ncbi:hypothetical protein Btru_022893 [Bulinus truncatus]|nr:hypothetical protein Btru_022893 [Bulinus truncatus]
MEDEDEEVIIENSALHQALISSGCIDVETVPRFSTDLKQDDLHNENVGDDDVHDSCHSSFFHHMTFNSLTGLFIPVKSLDRLYSQQHSVTLSHLVNSHVLSKEDQLFLHYFIEDSDHSDFPGLELNRRWILVVVGILAVFLLTLNWLFSPWTLPASFIMTVTSGHSLQCIGEHIHLLRAALFNALVIAAFFLPLVLIKNKIKKQILKELREKNEIFQQLEIQAWELMHLEKKCLRLIKETELVARGFTLATQHRVASSPYPGLSEANSPWCTQLRQMLLRENINLMSLIKAYVIKMMQNLPMICQDTDFGSLETMSYDSVNGLLHNRGIGKDFQDQNMDLDKRDYDLDLVSTARINKSVNLLHVYISGLIRRLALCFYVKNLKDKTIEPFSATLECVKYLTDAIQKTKINLTHFYTFGQALNRCLPEQSQSNMAARSDEFEYLYSCFRSISAHLSNALEQNEIIKNVLEGRADQAARRQSGVDQGDPNEVRIISEEEKAAFKETMKKVKASLDSCQSSYEMTVRQLNAKSIAESPGKIKRTESDRPAQRVEPGVRYVAAEENVIFDQVFEAVVSGVDDEVVLKNSSSQQSPEDQAKAKEIKEAIKLLSKELHSVVEKRAVTQQAREEMALARSRGDSLELSSPASQAYRPQLLSLAPEQPQVADDLSSRASNLSVKSNPESELSVDSASQLLLAIGETTDSDLSYQPQMHKEKCFSKQHESPRKRDGTKVETQLSDGEAENSDEAKKSPKRPKPKPRKHNYNQKPEFDADGMSSTEKESLDISCTCLQCQKEVDLPVCECFRRDAIFKPFSQPDSKHLDDSNAFRQLIFEPAPREFLGDTVEDLWGPDPGLAQREDSNLHEAAVRPTAQGYIFTRILAHSAASRARALNRPGGEEEMFGDSSSNDSE